jgi:hypothetical protein
VLAFVIFWVISFAFIQLGQRLFGGWPATEVGQLLASVLGVAMALRVRAPVVAYFLAAMIAFSASELAIHLVYGIRAAQGAPTHFAVLSAGVLGVALGALLMRRGGWSPGSGSIAVSRPSSHGPTVPNRDHSEAATSEGRSCMPLQPAGARS